MPLTIAQLTVHGTLSPITTVGHDNRRKAFRIVISIPLFSLRVCESVKTDFERGSSSTAAPLAASRSCALSERADHAVAVP
jgi:hypothetical protein